MTGTPPNTAVREVQHAITHQVSVFDTRFERNRERFGDAFVREYISEVSTHMGSCVVRAFEHHDSAQYHRCATLFGTVNAFLFPVSQGNAHVAGAGHALALRSHDVIEDGIHTVADEEPIGSDGLYDESDMPLSSREILSHGHWNSVLFGFELVGDALGLPSQFAVEQTEFFRFHTAAYESHDRARTLDEPVEALAIAHARRAQRLKFGAVVDDEELLETIADSYVAAVESHDAHTESEQEANVSRMTSVYALVLAELTAIEPGSLAQLESFDGSS